MILTGRARSVLARILSYHPDDVEVLATGSEDVATEFQEWVIFDDQLIEGSRPLTSAATLFRLPFLLV